MTVRLREEVAGITQHVVHVLDVAPQMTGGHSRDCIGKLQAITVSIARPGHPDACSCAPRCSSRVSVQPSSRLKRRRGLPLPYQSYQQKCDIHGSTTGPVNCCSWLLGTFQRQKVTAHTTCQSCIMKCLTAHGDVEKIRRKREEIFSRGRDR